MGKLQSKHACKRRENPEGGSFAANVLTCQRELECTDLHTHQIRFKQELCRREVKDEQSLKYKSPLQVVLPSEKGGEKERESYIHIPFRQPRKRNSHVDDTECNVVLEDDTRQEWVFTLYHFDNSGKVTKEDMSSLMQSIYEVVEASAMQPSCNSTALKVKLVVAPSSSSRTRDRIEEVQQEEAGSPERTFHCVDENTERRNHYLDLAGIENYSSKFDDADAPSQVPRPDARSDQQRRSVVVGKNCGPTESRGRGLSFLRSLRGQAKAVGEEEVGINQASSMATTPPNGATPLSHAPSPNSPYSTARARGFAPGPERLGPTPEPYSMCSERVWCCPACLPPLGA